MSLQALEAGILSICHYGRPYYANELNGVRKTINFAVNVSVGTTDQATVGRIGINEKLVGSRVKGNASILRTKADHGAVC